MSDRPEMPLASLGLLRRLTDRHVIEQLLGSTTMTRAELSAATGISKPTVSASVRRLQDDGLVVESGRSAPSGRRGPAGVDYALRADVGVALAIAAGPDGLTAEVADARGEIVRRVSREVPSPVRGVDLGPRLLGLVDDVLVEVTGPVQACCVSVAGPVDHGTGRLIHLPNSPFLVDELDVRATLHTRVGVDIVVDNDVNWEALAEHRLGVAVELTDFCYLHLGFGLGGAVVRGGQLDRGHRGLAGEVAHMITTGPDGRALRLIECFDALGLLRAGADTIDVERLDTVLRGRGREDLRTRRAVVVAISGVVASIAALLNPAGVVVGGPWAGVGDIVAELGEQARSSTGPQTPVLQAALDTSSPLLGARLAAADTLRSTILGPRLERSVG